MPAKVSRRNNQLNNRSNARIPCQKIAAPRGGMIIELLACARGSNQPTMLATAAATPTKNAPMQENNNNSSKTLPIVLTPLPDISTAHFLVGKKVAVNC